MDKGTFKAYLDTTTRTVTFKTDSGNILGTLVNPTIEAYDTALSELIKKGYSYTGRGEA